MSRLPILCYLLSRVIIEIKLGAHNRNEPVLFHGIIKTQKTTKRPVIGQRSGSESIVFVSRSPFLWGEQTIEDTKMTMAVQWNVHWLFSLAVNLLWLLDS